ncbi:MAG: hypothetical protein SVY53_03190 [Chloroflexota bacterium]|nr:hypothetical protein [Chloroflexota bacterium]
MAIYITHDREALSPSSATGFTAAKITTGYVVYARVQVKNAKCNYTVNGTTATTSIGEEVEPGDTFEVWGSEDMGNFSIIENGGTATVEVAYCGQGGG